MAQTPNPIRPTLLHISIPEDVRVLQEKIMTRLLFAAARGARIEYMVGYPNRYETFKNTLPRRDQPECRIHPDDLHLQYGPISTAIRENAECPWVDRDGTYTAPCSGQFWIDLKDYITMNECSNNLHRSLFLLILAEALADEGL